MRVTTDIENFVAAARYGDKVDPTTFVSYANQFANVVIWGAGNLGTALGIKLVALGVTVAAYWDIRSGEIIEKNGTPVIQPLSGGFLPERTLVIFAIGNVAVGPNIRRQLSENGWDNVVHGNDLLQGLLCPLSNEAPVKASVCNSFNICSVCSCERLHNIVRIDAARKNDLPPDETLSFDRVHFIVNNVCNLKCTHCFLYINSYPKERKQNVLTEQMLSDISVVLRAVHSFGVVNIFGGEPFLHKGIGSIVEKVLEHDNFGSVIVNTNGIAMITQKQLATMKDSRVRLAFSNYLEVLDERKKAVFFRNYEAAQAESINVQYQNSLPTWNMSSTLEEKGDTVEVMTRKKAECGVRYLYVFDGKLFPCSFTLSVHDLGIADNATDYVRLDPQKSPEEIRASIRQLINRPYYSACGRCEAFGSPALVAGAAEQGFADRYALPGSARRRRVRIPVVAAD